MQKLAFVLVLFAGVAGCAQTLVGSEAWFATPQGKAGLLRRASFDLECEETKLTVAPLGPARTVYQSTGVRGCEKSAVYIYSFHANAWVLDGAHEKK